MTEKKSYYAIIPADVRYDKKLCANAKLLYGEITALCNEKGYCWASNDYFAQLYEKTEETVSRWISQLIKQNYINAEYIKRGFEITERRIYILDCQKSQPSIDEKVNRSIDEKVKYNTTVNTTYNNTGNKKRQSVFTVPSLNEILSYISDNSLSVDGAFFLKYYTESNWIDSNGKKVINWKLKLLTWDKQNKTRKQKELDKRTGIDYPEL